MEEKGMQLILDCWKCNSVKLSDESVVRGLLDRIPDEIGMTKLESPRVIVHKAQKEENSGITGGVFLAESHLNLHTFPSRGYVGIDLYSCRHYEPSKVIAMVKEAFSPEKVDSNVLDRGVRIL